MAHYAFLDQNNVVTEVIVGKDKTDTTHDWEQYYGAIRNQVCKRTSYHGNIRGPLDHLPFCKQPQCLHLQAMVKVLLCRDDLVCDSLRSDLFASRSLALHESSLIDL